MLDVIMIELVIALGVAIIGLAIVIMLAIRQTIWQIQREREEKKKESKRNGK